LLSVPCMIFLSNDRQLGQARREERGLTLEVL
jgi:hypothetical protein